MTAPTIPTSLKLVSATVVPARVTLAGGKEKLAAYQAAQKDIRAKQAEPLVKGLNAGQALTDGATYVTVGAATKVAANVKRLVMPGLAAAGKRPTVRVSGADPKWTWHIMAIDRPIVVAAE